MSEAMDYNAAITACPTPYYHLTHRYCPSCPWTELGPQGSRAACDEHTALGADEITDTESPDLGSDD